MIPVNLWLRHHSGAMAACATNAAARRSLVTRWVAVAAIGAGLALGPPAFAQGARVSSPIELESRSADLQPGEWVWAPEIAPVGPLLIYVDLSSQLANVYRNGVRIGVSTISSGKPGHETPTGVFTILQKDADHRSSTYNNAPMPYQERLTWDGVALHAGGLPGYPESHGCVHLPLEFARVLFETTEIGGTVVVNGAASRPIGGAGGGILEPGDSSPHNPLAQDESFRWQPELSPSGPLTIVVSSTDGRIVVLRNGVEIGRSRIQLPEEPFETHLLTYSGTPEPHWVFVGVPGHGGEQGKPLDLGMATRARMPEAFRSRLREIIVPGTTLLFTQAPVIPDSTARQLTVLASAEHQ